MKRYFAIAACALLFAAACKKAETTPSRQDEMREGRWKVSSGNVRVDPFVGKDTTYNYPVFLKMIGDTCKVDDYLVFLENYDGEQHSGDFKCSLADPDAVPFRWQLFDNDQGIYFLNANETFFRDETIKAEFLNYTTGRFTIRHYRYLTAPSNPTKWDTLTFTQTFVKF